MRLDRALLDPSHEDVEELEDFQAADRGVHGAYSTERFVLRLSEEVHGLVDEAVAAAEAGEPIGDAALQGYSTYLHETVHWWQHIGSTAGLVMSLQYPAVSHSGAAFLNRLKTSVGPVMPLKTWAARQRDAGAGATAEVRDANVAINNAYDLTFFTRLMLEPLKANGIAAHPYFNTVGHSYWMGLGHAVSVLSATIDRNFDFLPDGRVWDGEIDRLRQSGAAGFAPGAPAALSPIGLRDLMEGQARFAQLQFLALASEAPPTVSELRAAGQLSGVYGAAFDAFLTLTGASEPETIDHPLVGVFMLILDLAINPTRGLVIQIETYEDFLPDIDPGLRFLQLCQAARDHPQTLASIHDYSRAEYAAVSSVLTEACGFDHPLAALEMVLGWRSQPSVQALLEEKRLHRYDPGNLVIRVLFAHFLEFSADRFEAPELFCWPGAWKVAPRGTDRTRSLWLKHLSLFTDRANDIGIFPRLLPGIPEDRLRQLLTDFFVNVMVYDLTRQWILGPPPFLYVYGWLSGRHLPAELEAGARGAFETVFGVDPEKFDVLF